MEAGLHRDAWIAVVARVAKSSTGTCPPMRVSSPWRRR